MTRPAGSAGSPVVLISRDDALARQVGELVEAADAGPCQTTATCPADLTRSRVVLLGADLLDPQAESGGVTASVLARRRDVVLVGRQLDGRAVAAAADRGIDRVIVLPEGRRILFDLVAGTSASGSGAGWVVGVTGATGGCGASTVATGLALAHARRSGHPCWLIDADPLGGGLDLPLGIDAVSAARWADLPDPAGGFNPVALADRLAPAGPLRVLAGRLTDAWSTPCSAAAVREVVRAGRGLGGGVVVDLPRGGSTEAGSAWRLVDAAVLVVENRIRSVGTAAIALQWLADVGQDPVVVVRDHRDGLWPADVCDALDRDVFVLPQDRSLRAAAERGDLGHALGRGRVRRILDDVAGELSLARSSAA